MCLDKFKHIVRPCFNSPKQLVSLSTLSLSLVDRSILFTYVGLKILNSNVRTAMNMDVPPSKIPLFFNNFEQLLLLRQQITILLKQH